MAGLIVVPIERLPERYSDQWFVWFDEAFKKLDQPVEYVGDVSTQFTIEQGEFLDVFQTQIYKFTQLKEIIEKIKSGWRGTLFFMDLWMPGLESLAYIRDTLKLPIRITGLLHAGTYDPEDFLSASGCGSWGGLQELSWFSFVDTIYVSTKFHKHLLTANRAVSPDKVKLVQFPVYQNALLRANIKENQVVFPHRLAPEKHLEIFHTVQTLYKYKYPLNPLRWVVSKEVCTSKAEYYELLSRSKVAFSSASQETFGIAMQEAVNMGAWPIAPNKLSYPETLADSLSEGLYDTLEQAVDKIYEACRRPNLPPEHYFMTAESIVRSIIADMEG